MAKFITLKRVYKLKGGKTLKTQSITVKVSAIESVRVSNRLGFPEHRSTMTLVGGAVIDLANELAAVNTMLAATAAR